MVTMRVNHVFFDTAKVLRAVGRAKRQVLSQAGGTVRKLARWSIRQRKKPSAPGEPPHSHEGTLKRFLFYTYDQAADSVVIGPMKTNQVFFDRDGKPVRGTVPQVLEFGGGITILEVFKPWVRGGGKWVRADLRSRRRLAGLKKRYRTVKIAARPYMAPALAKVRPELPRMWAGSVKGD